MRALHVLLVYCCFWLTGCVTPSTLMVNDDGKVIRCASYGSGSAIALGTAQAIHNTCVRDAKTLGYVPLPPVYLGIRTDSFESPVVKSVSAGAERAGMQPGDLLLAYDGQPSHSYMQLLRLLATKSPGDIVQVKVRRGEQELLFAVTVGLRGE